MTNRTYGVISLLLVIVALAIGLWAVASHNTQAAWWYGLGLVTLPAVVVYAYCAKCSSRFQCGHVVPGWLTRFLPPRPSGPYSLADLMGTGVPLAILFIFPQIWLWQHFGLWLLFWGLLGIAGWEIRSQVCPACQNQACPVHRQWRSAEKSRVKN